MKRAALACATVLASGCVTPAVYEPAWPQQVTVGQGDCPAVDGFYRNAGASYVESDGELRKKELSLAHFLNGGGFTEVHQAADRLGTTYLTAKQDYFRTVRIERSGDKLHVQATREDGISRSFALPLNHRCRNSLLILESGWGYNLFSAGLVRGYYAIGRAEDGSLLAYQSYLGEELAVFWTGESVWTLFPQEDQVTAREAGVAPSDGLTRNAD